MRIVINNKKIGFWLPNPLFNDLKICVENQNKLGTKPKLNFTKAAYIMNLLFYIPLKKPKKYQNGWVPICSELLKVIKHYKIYLKFLIENDFLVESDIEYSTTANRCKQFKLAGTYSKQKLQYHIFSDNSHFIKKQNELKIKKMRNANNKCEHLTTYLNPENLNIDVNAAYNYINKTYQGKSNRNRKNSRIFAIESIKNKYWSFSREGKDNRLHSILTLLPKDLRNFITYNNESLVSYDIKNSQPFIFSSILNQISNPNINIMNGFISSFDNSMYSFIMSDLFRNDININNINKFINEIIDGKFYEIYGDILFNEGILSEDINKKCYLINLYNKKEKCKSYKMFNCRREASKYAIMLTLYSSEKFNSNITKVFETQYPEVFKVLQFIKKDREKSFFPILMQNIEADCLLDYCTAKIAKKYPNMPLLTIHDSIITTVRYQLILEEEFKKYLKLYFGLNPKLEVEYWSEQISKAS